MEIWRIEVDSRYFDDLAVSIEEDVSTVIDTAIDLVQDTLNCFVRGFYINTEEYLVSFSVGLWSNK